MTEATDWGSVADWVSGTGSWIAVVVALLGYFLVEWQRRKAERDVVQGHVYQIGFKLSTLASEARTTLKDLSAVGIPLADLLKDEDVFKVVGEQQATVGYDTTMVRDLSDAEQNLLMLDREEEFLMNLSECIARNESVRTSIVDYSRRRELIAPHLPKHVAQQGQVVSYNLTQSHLDKLLPTVIPAASLLKSARYLASVNVGMITKLCADFQPMMKRHHPKLHVHQIYLAELPLYEDHSPTA